MAAEEPDMPEPWPWLLLLLPPRRRLEDLLGACLLFVPLLGGLGISVEEPVVRTEGDGARPCADSRAATPLDDMLPELLTVEYPEAAVDWPSGANFGTGPWPPDGRSVAPPRKAVLSGVGGGCSRKPCIAAKLLTPLAADLGLEERGLSLPLPLGMAQLYPELLLYPEWLLPHTEAGLPTGTGSKLSLCTSGWRCSPPLALAKPATERGRSFNRAVTPPG